MFTELKERHSAALTGLILWGGSVDVRRTIRRILAIWPLAIIPLAIFVLAGDNASFFDAFMNAILRLSIEFIAENIASRLNNKLNLKLIHVLDQILDLEFGKLLIEKIFLRQCKHDRLFWDMISNFSYPF